MRRAVGGLALAILIVALLVASGCGGSSPSATSTPPPAGEEITVTPDSIEFGDRLVGSVSGVATDDGDVYVLGRHFEPADGNASSAVLAAFDDGVERWRTTLDGTPGFVAIADGDPWVSHSDGTVTRIDSSDGRILDHVTIEHHPSLGLVGAFGSVWASPRESFGRPSRLVRIDPDDLSTTGIVELGDCSQGGDIYFCHAPVAGAGALWVPLGDGGVAMIDPDTNEATVIGVDDIGHEVHRVAVDGDVVYVASGYQVTSIVDGEVRATVDTGAISYLGPIAGVFGVLDMAGQFRVLGANDPMVLEFRDVSTEGLARLIGEIDGEAWTGGSPGQNLDLDLRRLEFLPASD